MLNINRTNGPTPSGSTQDERRDDVGNSPRLESALPPRRSSSDSAMPRNAHLSGGAAQTAAAAVANAMRQIVQAHLGAGSVPEDVHARLQDNAALLVGAGLDTPQKVQHFVDECWRHDAALAGLALGLTGNAGYFAGMTAANERLVALLPKSVLGNAPLLGMLVGLGVGALDVLISVAGSAAVGPKIYNGPGGELPASVPQPSGLRQWMASIARATGLNVAKNLTRPIAVPIQAAIEGAMGAVPAGTVDRVWSDRIDASMLDGGLGFIASAANKVLELGDGAPYDVRLLLRTDLGAVLDKQQGVAQDPPAAVAARVGKAFASPVPVAVVAIIGTFISALFAANTAIDEYGHAQVDPVPPDRGDARVMAGKRVSSVLMMGAMTAAIELAAPLVAKGAASASRALGNLAAGGWPGIGAWATQALPFLRQATQPPQLPGPSQT